MSSRHRGFESAVRRGDRSYNINSVVPCKKLLDTITLVLMDWKTFLEKGNGSPKLQTGLTLTPVSKGSGWTDISK